MKDLHAILAEHLETKAEGGDASPAGAGEASPAASPTAPTAPAAPAVVLVPGLVEKFKPFPAALLSELRVESLMKATELAESAKAAGRKVEDAALECGNFAAANAKLKEELKDSDAAEVLRKVPLYLLRLQAAQQTSEAYVQATVACEKDMRRREARVVSSTAILSSLYIYVGLSNLFVAPPVSGLQAGGGEAVGALPLLRQRRGRAAAGGRSALVGQGAALSDRALRLESLGEKPQGNRKSCSGRGWHRPEPFFAVHLRGLLP